MPITNMRDHYLEVEHLPPHLATKENLGWFASIKLEAISKEGNVILVRTWRKSSGGKKVIESVIQLREDESITFTDGGPKE